MRNLSRKAEIVLGFFTKKGFLVSNDSFDYHGEKMHLQDVLEVAENVEPRVYEVLPAALLRFPASFVHLEALPSELKEIVDAIRLRKEDHKGYKWVKYKEMKRWSEIPLPDKRTRHEKRILRSYRFLPATLSAIKDGASKWGLTETGFIEKQILK